LATLVSLPRIARAEPVQIEYWQYFFKERVGAMEQLIQRFQAANPGITVKQTTFPTRGRMSCSSTTAGCAISAARA
jgi:multiple sugar transport system substrate-binding protein